MPTYDYSCQECGYKFEEIQSIKADPLVTCPNCHKNALKRHWGKGAGLIFKGNGFYITDYKKNRGNTQKKQKDEKTESSSSGLNENKEKKSEKNS